MKRHSFTIVSESLVFLSSQKSRIVATVILVASFVVTVVIWQRANRPPQPELLRTAISAAEAGHAKRAIALFDKFLQSAPSHPLALLYRAQLAREAGDRELCLQLLHRISENSPKEAGTARFVEATMMLESHRAKEAEQLFRRAVELNPRYLPPLERLANLYMTQLRGVELRQTLEAIQSLRPLTLDELIVYTEARGTVMFPEEAIPRLKEFVDADAHDLESRTALGAYLILGDQLSSAILILKETRTLFPNDGRALALLADALVRKAELSEARSIVDQLLTNSASHSWLWRSLGDYALATGQFNDAAAYFLRSLQSNPEDLAVAYKLGQALERSQKHDLAQQVLQRTRLMEKLALAVFRLRVGNRKMLETQARIVIEICEYLLQLDRGVESLAWVQLALSWYPDDSQLRQLRQRCQQMASSTSGLRWELPELVANERPLPRPTRPVVGSLASGDKSPIRLTDCHREARLDFRYDNGQSEHKYLMETLGGGVAVLDYDNDGWPDLYFTQGGALPVDPSNNPQTDRLFRNLGDGEFLDVTEMAGVGDRQYSQGCTAGDYDNDGHVDLFVANFGTNVVYRNNGDGTFTDVTAECGLRGDHWSTSLALSDLDGDGDLDLYVTTYVLEPWKTCRTTTGKMSTRSPGNFSGEQDLLYLNQGDGSWKDNTEAAGILAPDGKGLGVVVADFDDDGRPDIYVANDGTPNFLFHNTGRNPDGQLRFEEVGLTSGGAVNADGSAQAGMGIACGDLNGDHRLDLYVTNFYQEYNTLYLNEGDMLFRDATREAQLVEPTKPMLGFGTQAVDFDLDGRLDLVVTNGHIDDFRFRGEPWKMTPQLFWNRGDTLFVDASTNAGAFFQGERLGRGLAHLDFNRDGLPDVVIVHQDQPTALLRNDTAECGRAIAITFHGVSSNRDALGTRIKCTIGTQSYIREITSGDGFFASNERRIILGAGEKTRFDSIEIIWPSGRRQSWTDVSTGVEWVLVEGLSPVSRSLQPVQ